MKVTTVGVDLAKRVFQLHGVDQHGRVVLRKRLSRSKLTECLTHLPPCLIGMEACGGAHYWARKFQQMGHEVKLISPQFIKPYVKSNKNDYNDAEAICEAVSRPQMRFVPVKGVAQQDIQALHRIRERLIGARTAVVNQTKGAARGVWHRPASRREPGAQASALHSRRCRQWTDEPGAGGVCRFV